MGGVDPLVPTQSICFAERLLAHLAREHSWMFDHVLLKFPPGVFMHLAISVRAAVTRVLLLMSFAGDVGVEHGSTSVLRTLELGRHLMLF